MHPDISEVLFSKEQIAQRVAEMGDELTEMYRDKEGGIVLVSVLRGAAIFMSDLAREIKLPLEMDYMAVSSYGASATSCGTVTVLKDLTSDVEGRHVIIAEDVLDTGLTLEFLVSMIKKRNPASLTVVPLFRKFKEGQAEIECPMYGFECPNEFIVGYGLDFAERYRNLPYVGALKPEVYQS